MPYDPTLPQEHTLIDAVQMRGQLNALKDLIDALPTITGAVVDGVTTLNPGDAASVTLSVLDSTLHFSFGIPPGQEGQAGQTGGVGPTGPPFAQAVVDGVLNLSPGDLPTVVATFDGANVHFLFGLPRGFDGNPGGQGPVGPTGPQFTSFMVDGVNTLNPGDAATVQTNFDGSNVRFTFGIPRGFTGNDGGMGSQGPPGEVSNAQLTTAINSTSSNSNAVSTLDTPFANDPPTLADMETMRAKMNELITALRR